jgi:S-phase kinase-associated protein 1
MLEDAEEDVPTIPVPNVDKKTLDKVIEYCRYHWNNRADEIERPLKSKLEDVISQWDQTYVTIDKPFLVELIMAANYLNNKDLLDLTCAKVHILLED